MALAVAVAAVLAAGCTTDTTTSQTPTPGNLQAAQIGAAAAINIRTDGRPANSENCSEQFAQLEGVAGLYASDRDTFMQACTG